VVAVERALGVYNEVRYARTQEVVQSTRAACDLFQWRDPEVGRNPERFGREITELFHRVWKYDIDGMVEEALAKLDADV
jgi:salicylate hydroxylase